jgi:hypothetical protein
MANVNVLKIGHALVAGERGDKGGKPSKDSIWGVAMINDRVLSFSGRRNAAVLRFKTHRKADLEALMALYALKLEGKDVKGIQYTDIVGDAMQETLVPGLVERISKGYNKAKRDGKLDIRSTTPAAKVVPVAVVEVDTSKVFVFPTSASMAAKS